MRSNIDLDDSVKQKKTVRFSEIPKSGHFDFGHYRLERAWKYLPVFFQGNLKRLHYSPILVSSEQDSEYLEFYICKGENPVLELNDSLSQLSVDNAVATIDLSFASETEAYYEIDYVSSANGTTEVLTIEYGDNVNPRPAYEFPVSVTRDEKGLHFSFGYASLLCLSFYLEYPKESSVSF